MDLQGRLGIYVDYDSSLIIHYFKSLTCDLFTARFANSHFDKTVILPLGGEKKVNDHDEQRELEWLVLTMSHFDPIITQCKTKVQL